MREERHRRYGLEPHRHAMFMTREKHGHRGAAPGWCPAWRRLALALLVASSGALRAQQVGVLRDPQRSVFGAFPDATAYRTIVRDIDRAARLAIEKALPFELHFHELGAHGLYVALRGKRPVGLLYVRSEESEWGFAEVVWTMTLDLRVTGFHLQRCRSRRLMGLTDSAFSRSLRGAGLADLAARLDAGGTLAEPAPGVSRSDQALATALVCSAMKALAVTATVWREDIARLGDLSLGLEMFPSAESVRSVSLAAAEQRAAAAAGVAVRLVAVSGAHRTPLGFAAATTTGRGDGALALRWKLRPDGRVMSVVPASPWPDDATRASCRDLIGKRVTRASSGDRVRSTAFRLYQLVAARDRGSVR